MVIGLGDTPGLVDIGQIGTKQALPGDVLVWGLVYIDPGGSGPGRANFEGIYVLCLEKLNLSECELLVLRLLFF